MLDDTKLYENNAENIGKNSRKMFYNIRELIIFKFNWDDGDVTIPKLYCGDGHALPKDSGGRLHALPVNSCRRSSHEIEWKSEMKLWQTWQ